MIKINKMLLSTIIAAAILVPTSAFADYSNADAFFTGGLSSTLLMLKFVFTQVIMVMIMLVLRSLIKQMVQVLPQRIRGIKFMSL
jgi:hypothetical protein